jgi:DDE superfamily endonuclease
MASLTPEMKYGIVAAMKETNNLSGTARTVGCSRAAARRWWARYLRTGGVDVKDGTGRKPILSNKAAEAALDLLLSHDTDGAADVARQLAAAKVVDKVVHKSTVIRAARRVAEGQGTKLWVKRGKPSKGMTEATKQKRYKFAVANKNRAWGQVLFTDRKKFHLSYPGSKVQPVRWVLGASKGSEEGVFQPNHPQCLNIYAGISKYGVTHAHVVAGSSKHSTQHANKKGEKAKNITTTEYIEVLKTTLLPEGARLFSAQGISTWYLQQDNDPTHSCAKQVVQEWNAGKGSSVQVLSDWPPNSPDLNIIENVWSWVATEVNKLGCTSLEEFKAAVLAKLAAVPKATLTQLYNSLHKRMALVIENGGGSTGY